MAASATSMEYVQKMFLAYFGRPVVPTGQEYYAGLVDAGQVAALQDDFWNSAESQAKFGALTTEAKVDAIFNQLFGRDPEVSGLSYWTAEINAGRVSLPQAALTILNSAAAADLEVFNAKLEVANAFTAELDTTAEILAYQSNIADAVVLLAGVTSAAEADAAVADITNLVADVVAGGAVVAGQTFTLTAGIDVVNGTNANDTIIGDDSGSDDTINAGDQINGGEGNDTVKFYDWNGTLPSLSSVENLHLIKGHNDLNVAAISGVTNLIVETDDDAHDFTLDGTKQTATFQNVAGDGDGDDGANLTYTVSTTAATVVLNDAEDSATDGTSDAEFQLDITGSALTTLNLVSKTNANRVDLTQGTDVIKTVNVTGDADLYLDATDVDTITTVDASKATGGVTFVAPTSALKFTGGSGDDRVEFAATEFTVLDVVDLGAGEDTLAIADTTVDASTAATLNKAINAVTGAEVLAFTGAGATLNNAVITNGITGFSLEGVGGYTITNAVSANTFTYAVDNKVSTDSIANKLGEQTTNIELVATAVDNASTGGTLTLTGITVVNVDSSFSGAGIQAAVNEFGTTSLTHADNIVINVTGNHNLTIGTLDGTTTGSTVNASAFTGKLVVTGSTLADSITGGSGADTITGGGGADSLTGGAGKDKFVFASYVSGTAASDLDTTAGAVTATITDFVTGSDTIGGWGAAGSSTNYVEATAAAADLAALLVAAGTALDGTVEYYVGQVGGDSYLVTDEDGTGYTDVIKLTGVTLDKIAFADIVA